MNGITPPNSPNNQSSNQSSPYQKATDECPICFDAFDKREVNVAEQCKHMFHKDCLTRWLSENTTCPVCRTSLMDREVQPLPAMPLRFSFFPRFDDRVVVTRSEDTRARLGSQIAFSQYVGRDINLVDYSVRVDYP